MVFIFSILMILVFGKMLIWAIRAAWGLAMILLTVVFFPLILIGMAFGGLLYLALPIVVVVGIIALICSD